MSSIAWTHVPAEDAAEYREERALVEAAKHDPAAFAELYRQHYPTIASFVHRRVGDEHEADDIISEVFLSLVTQIQRYQCRGIPFRIWLFRLATTQLSRWARRRRRWAMRQLEEATMDATSCDSQPDSEMVDLVLSTLPTRLQTVLSLHYLEELKIADIASVMTCSEGTIKSRLSEGRALMRDRLNQRGFRDGHT